MKHTLPSPGDSAGENNSDIVSSTQPQSFCWEKNELLPVGSSQFEAVNLQECIKDFSPPGSGEDINCSGIVYNSSMPAVITADQYFKKRNWLPSQNIICISSTLNKPHEILPCCDGPCKHLISPTFLGDRQLQTGWQTGNVFIPIFRWAAEAKEISPVLMFCKSGCNKRGWPGPEVTEYGCRKD